MKQAGTAWLRPSGYEAIVLPGNSAAGFVMGGIAFGFGFAVIWHIWWAAIAAALGILAAVIVRTWRDDQDYTLPAAEPLEVDADRAFGFWIYLMSDAVIFALLFATYAVMHRNYAGGPTGQELFDLGHTFAETLLLCSSIAYGFVSLAVARARRVQARLWLGVAFLLGLGFVLMELAEFNAMIAHEAGPDRSGFLSAFFTLVGTHGTHVSLGLIWILVMMAQVTVKGLTAPVRSRLLRLGMFWHFLDIMWIGIFPSSI